MKARTTMHHADLLGGLQASLRGITTTIAPVLLFVSLLGPQAMAASFWAALITATLVPAVHMLLKSRSGVIPGARMASLAAYISLVIAMTDSAGHSGHGAAVNLGADQLRVALAAGSLMYMAASAMIWLCGVLRIGNLFKMIPMPVTAGISNGTALLLLTLAMDKLTHHDFRAVSTAIAMVGCFLLWPRIQAMLPPLKQVPAVVIALLVGLVLAAQMESPFQMPMGSGTLDWTWVSMRLWPELPQSDLAHLIRMGLPNMLTLALVMILETFTAANTMEQRFGVRVNANRELMVLGGSNMVSAMLGGVPCTGHNSRSIASWLAGGRGTRVALFGLALTGALLLALGQWLMALPVGMVAGLLLLQCLLMAEREVMHRVLEMVHSRQWRQEGTSDLGFWTTIVITVVEYIGSMIWACSMGIGLSCLVILRRVSDSLTARWGYLDHHRSRRVRTVDETQTLNQQSDRVGVLRLSGHLFFGNSIRLNQLADELKTGALAVVIDVSRVHDVDPSGLDALVWLIRALIEQQASVVVAGLKQTRSPELRKALHAMEGIRLAIDLDRGLEFCENLVLASAPQHTPAAADPDLLNNSLLEDLTPHEREVLLALGQPRVVAKGEALFHKDDAVDGVWLLQEGYVSILSGDAHSTRFSTLGPNQFLGEMSLIDGKRRSATALADSPVRALLLDQEAMAILTRQEPEAALKIMRNIARYLSYRVRNASDLLTGALASG